MDKLYRFMVGVLLSAAMLAGSASFTLTQADAPIVRGTASAHTATAIKMTLPSSSLTDVGILDPILQTTPEPTTSATTSAFYLVSVSMAKGVQGQDNSPVNPTSIFSATDTFHAVAMIKDAPVNTNFTSIWYAVNVGSAAQPNTVIDTAQVLTDGTRNIDFSLMPQTNSSWPAGVYSVEIDVNGVKGAEIYFTVQ